MIIYEPASSFIDKFWEARGFSQEFENDLKRTVEEMMEKSVGKIFFFSIDEDGMGYFYGKEPVFYPESGVFEGESLAYGLFDCPEWAAPGELYECGNIHDGLRFYHRIKPRIGHADY